MTEHELLTWLEAWFRDNTPLTVDSASPRSEAYLSVEVETPDDYDILNLRDLAEAIIELGRAEHRRAEMRFIIFGEVAP